jgi:putative ATP-binding cassette transporter
MNIVIFLFKRSRWLLLVAVVSGICSGLIGAGLVALIGNCINGSGSSSDSASTFFLLCLLSVFAKSCSAISLIHLSQSAMLQLRIELSRKLLATSYAKLRAIGKAELLAILTNDIAAFTQGVQTLPLIFGDAILIASCLGYLAFLSWQLFTFIALALIGGMCSYHYAERIPLGRLRTMRRQMDVLFRNFRNLIEGSRELQLNAKRGTFFVEEVVGAGAAQFKRLFVSAMVSYAWVVNLGAVAFLLVIGCVMFWVPMWLAPAPGITAKFTLTLLYLVGPITALTSSLPTLMQAGIALKKIQQLDGGLALEHAAPLHAEQFRRPGPLKLELNAVCHRYPSVVDGSSFLLGPLNLTVKQGEIVYIVGGNGSGKTTLAMLLLGFYQPESGTVVLNGVVVNENNLASYRQHFSAIFADFHLFEQLIDADEPDLSARASLYLKKFGMENKVKIVNGKFSNVDLSTGQCKRLALILAYLEDRPIYLFDEWAADQDPVFKRVFYTELLPDLKLRGKTVLAITHDDAYFAYADRVFRLENGKLVDSEPAVQAYVASA